MLNTTKAFLLSLMQLFIVYIVLGNFLGWSGGAISLTGYTDVDWQNSYIGFESFTSAIEDFTFVHDVLSMGIFDLSHFVDYLRDLLDSLMAGLPNLITKIVNTSSINGWDLLNFILGLIIQPFKVLFYSLATLACVLIYLVSFVLVLFRFLGGRYNCYMTATDDVWNQWSYLSSEWDWSSILSVPVV